MNLYIIYLENENHKVVVKNNVLKNKPFSWRSRMVYFFYPLCISIIIAIIKVRFMIVRPTNPKKSSSIIVNNAVSIISTTSNFRLTVKTVVVGERKVATHSAYSHFLCFMIYNIFLLKSRQNVNYLHFYSLFPIH